MQTQLEPLAVKFFKVLQDMQTEADEQVEHPGMTTVQLRQLVSPDSINGGWHRQVLPEGALPLPMGQVVQLPALMEQLPHLKLQTPHTRAPVS